MRGIIVGAVVVFLSCYGLNAFAGTIGQFCYEHVLIEVIEVEDVIYGNPVGSC